MSLLATRTQNVRSKSNLDKYEIRPSRYGALEGYVDDTNRPDSIITPELKRKAFSSIGSTLETPVIDYDGSITIGSSRSVTVADSELTSAMQSISFTTYVWGFTQVPSLFHNNEIEMQKDFNKKFYLYLHKFLSTLDTAALTNLNSNKTQVWADYLSYTDPTTTSDIVKSATANQDNFLGDINIMMEANDYFGDIRFISNGGFQSIIRAQQEFGLYNSQKKEMQADDKTLHYSVRLTNGAGDKATGYAVQKGSLGLLTRVDREALYNRKTNLSYEWGTMKDPAFNLTLGTMFYESVGDFNAIAGAATADMTASYKHHYGFSVDVAFVPPYASDIANNANAIMKCAVTTA